jgi:hypothetical protein
LSVKNDESIVFLFYDINQINFFKYIPTLLHALSNDLSYTILLCYEEATEDKAALKFLSEFVNIKIGVFPSIMSVFKKYQIDLVVVNAQRIPDSLCVSYANNLGIPTLMIQHGMYNGHLRRSNELYTKKLFKTLKYLLYSLQVGWYCDRNVFDTGLKFVKAFSFGDSYKTLFESYHQIYARHVHVYGQYWIKYHKSFFGYSEERTNFHIVGYPELSRELDDRKVNFCYIAQSLFEDGRATLSELSKPLKMLENLSRNYSVVVKRHPRSINKIYEDYGLETSDSLTDADVFIGHYSSLLALPIVLGKKVALISLSGHDIPDYFQISAYSADSTTALVSILQEASQPHDIRQVFEFPIDPKAYKQLLASIVEDD